MSFALYPSTAVSFIQHGFVAHCCRLCRAHTADCNYNRSVFITGIHSQNCHSADFLENLCWDNKANCSFSLIWYWYPESSKARWGCKNQGSLWLLSWGLSINHKSYLENETMLCMHGAVVQVVLRPHSFRVFRSIVGLLSGPVLGFHNALAIAFIPSIHNMSAGEWVCKGI